MKRELLEIHTFAYIRLAAKIPAVKPFFDNCKFFYDILQAGQVVKKYGWSIEKRAGNLIYFGKLEKRVCQIFW